MKGINKTITVGTVGKDPESKDFPNGGKVVLFSMATNEKWTDKNTGEVKTATEWHRFSAKGAIADIIMKYVKKGMHLYVEGQLKTRQWTDQSGAERYVTEINVREMQMLDSPRDGEPRQGGQQNNQNNYQNNQGGYSNQNNQGGGYQSDNGYGYNPGFR